MQTQEALSFTELVLNASFLVQCVMLFLLALSIVSWTIIISRNNHYRLGRSKADEFEDRFWSGIDLNNLYQDCMKKPNDLVGLEVIYSAGFKEFVRLVNSGPADQDVVMDGTYRQMKVACSREVELLENHLPTLATIGSISPYIGLFGTVWGIMHAFVSLAAVKNATLAMVAPPIAEALIATAMGLFAAIPAVMFYNRFVTKVEALENRYYNFMDEFSTILNRRLVTIRSQLSRNIISNGMSGVDNNMTYHNYGTGNNVGQTMGQNISYATDQATATASKVQTPVQGLVSGNDPSRHSGQGLNAKMSTSYGPSLGLNFGVMPQNTSNVSMQSTSGAKGLKKKKESEFDATTYEREREREREKERELEREMREREAREQRERALEQDALMSQAQAHAQAQAAIAARQSVNAADVSLAGGANVLGANTNANETSAALVANSNARNMAMTAAVNRNGARQSLANGAVGAGGAGGSVAIGANAMAANKVRGAHPNVAHNNVVANAAVNNVAAGQAAAMANAPANPNIANMALNDANLASNYRGTVSTPRNSAMANAQLGQIVGAGQNAAISANKVGNDTYAGANMLNGAGAPNGEGALYRAGVDYERRARMNNHAQEEEPYYITPGGQNLRRAPQGR